MRSGFFGGVVAVGLVLAASGVEQRAIAQQHEPTIDERFREADSKAADKATTQLNAPPSNLAPPNVAKRKGKTAYLGVTFAASEPRAIVLRVVPGSPAEQAGLQPNDLIETMQGRQVRTNQDVLDIVAMLKAGEVLDIGFSRRMNIRTQTPLASLPTSTPHYVGYPPNLSAGPMAAPEDPEQRPVPTILQKSSRDSAQQDSSNSSRPSRNNGSNNDRSKENWRVFGRGLRLR